MKRDWVLMIGRWQVLPPHKGHEKLIRTVLNEGKNVQIGIRKADGGEKNPYNYSQRRKALSKMFEKEIKQGRVKLVNLEDIVEVVHGRKVGWKVRQIHLDKEIEDISGTKERAKKGKK